jgi:hypothetical protein
VPLPSGEKGPWEELLRVQGNEEFESRFLDAFFVGKWLKVEMQRALDVRDGPPDQGSYCFSIKEVEVSVDNDKARLMPTNQTYELQYAPNNMIDGDLQSYW